MALPTTIERERVIAARPEQITPLLADFHRWVDWSPWEGTDRDLQRSYEGVPGVVGSSYTWKGNRKAGAGSMVLTRSEPTVVDVDLRFTAPFRSTSEAAFRLHPVSGGTRVVWTMTTPQTFMSRMMGKVLRLDDLIGKDFEKGLAQLDTAARR